MKTVVAVLEVLDIISLTMTLVSLITGQEAFVTAYFILQTVFFTGILAFYFVRFKASEDRIRQACADFVMGKTLKLEIQLNDLKYKTEFIPLLEKLNEAISRNDRVLLTHKEAEYLALQNQINPHFLYNTLEAIRADALTAGLPSLAGTAEALASFFRYTISDGDLLSTVEDELMNIRNYFFIQRYRFGDGLKLEITFIDQEDEIRKLCVPKLTLQPIVENCVFHGLETKKNKGTIRISFDQTPKFLFISVKDDGIGMSAQAAKRLNDSLIESPFQPTNEKEQWRMNGEIGKQHTGIALKNVSQRIKLLFGNEYGITIYSASNIGTNVKIVLPRQEKVPAPDGGRGL